MLRPFGDVSASNGDAALIHRIRAGDRVHQRRFARAVAANDRDEISRCQMQADVMQGQFLRDGPWIEGLGNVFDMQHQCTPFRNLFQRACKSGSDNASATRMAVNNLRSLGGMPICSTMAMTAR